MRRALIGSLVFHVVVLAGVMLGLPRFGEHMQIEESITVDLVGEPARRDEEIVPEPVIEEPAEAAPLPERQAASPAQEVNEPPPEPDPQPEPPPPPPPPPPPVERVEPAPPPEPAPEPAPAPEPQLAALPAVKPAPPEPPAEPEGAPPPEQAATPSAPLPMAKPKPPAPPVVAKAEPEPPPAKKPPEKAPEKPPEEKPVERTQAPDEKATQETTDFAALLKSVEQLNKRVEAETKREGQGRGLEDRPRSSDNDAPVVSTMSASEIAGIKRQIERCWNVPVGVRSSDIKDMRVTLRIQLSIDGEPVRVDIEDQARLGADPTFRIVAESARRAVLGCRITAPRDKFELWRDTLLTFFPRDAISG